MAKLFGSAINLEAEEEGGGGSSIAGEVSQSGIQPDGEAMSFPVFLSPFNQRESGDCNPCFRFLESNSDSGSASVDSEPDLHNGLIDFFDRESYEVGEFQRIPDQRLSTWGDCNIWGFHETEEETELGLGIGSGSGSGQRRGDSGGAGLEVTGTRESDSGRVEVGTGLTPSGDDLFGEAMLADEELEWVDLQNAISWVPEPGQVSLFSLEQGEEEEEEEEEEEARGEELFLASRDDDQNVHWEVVLPVDNVGFFGEAEDIEVDSGLMQLDYRMFLDSIEIEFDENHGDYNAVFEQRFDQETGGVGSPPASKSVVDDLPVVEMTAVELSNGNIVCAICKDEIVAEEKVKRLPCRHYYHGECIIPWLGIRNTCPVCRYELPTDDLEYERNRRRSQSRPSPRDLMSE